MGHIGSFLRGLFLGMVIIADIEWYWQISLFEQLLGPAKHHHEQKVGSVYCERVQGNRLWPEQLQVVMLELRGDLVMPTVQSLWLHDYAACHWEETK